MSDKESKWTQQQSEAIEARDCNLLVAAGAGSGKTAVLVERIIRKVTDKINPIDIDKILVVTFTNAAAAEMRGRIAQAFSLEMEKDQSSHFLQRQLALLGKASITTIHSFCLDVIRSNFHMVDLDPGFKIAEEAESILLKEEALEQLFEERYEKEENLDIFHKLVECYGGNKDDSRLLQLVLDVHSFVQSDPWPDKWLDAAAQAFNIEAGSDFSETNWGRTLIKNIEIELSGIKDTMIEAVAIIKSDDNFSSYLVSYMNDLNNIEILLDKCKTGNWDDLYKYANTIDFIKLKACAKDSDEKIKEQLKKTRDNAKDLLKDIKEQILYAESSEICSEMNQMYPVIFELCSLVKSFDYLYKINKKEKNLLDFNDIEHYCLQILVDSDNKEQETPAVSALKERFVEIYIDEYQDSNHVQETILTSIARKKGNEPNNIFMVGDLKQSIYRFRQADPQIFNSKYESYAETSGKDNYMIKLRENFRSRKSVIDAVNFVFTKIMSKDVGELDYNHKETLIYGADYEKYGIEDSPVELNIIDLTKDSGEISGENNSESSSEEEEEKKDRIEYEAHFVAQRIKDLMREKENIKYKDIVILMRATRNWSETFSEVLSKEGIPVFSDTGGGYFETVEIETILSLLQIIDNPYQDIPLLSVLRSPIAFFQPEELIDIRLADRDNSIYEAMKKLAEGITATASKCGEFLEKLNYWRDMAPQMPTDQLIWQLYTETGYYSYMGAMANGQQKQANLRILFERARLYEESSYKGLFNFINFVNRIKSSRGDMGSAKILGENEDLVRIMSIHKSKGLEFPVVILAGTGKMFNRMDSRGKMLIHQELGLGPDFVDPVKRITYPTVAKQALKYKINIENLSEEMRILYVAMTRAKEKLIIFGTVKSMEMSKEFWQKADYDGVKLSQYETLNSNSYLDWFGKLVFNDNNSSWLINMLSVSQLKKEAKKQESDVDIESIFEYGTEEEEDAKKVEIEKILDWKYPLALSEKLPVKLTVTELKRYYEEKYDFLGATSDYVPPIVKRPSFLEQQKSFTAAEKGSIVHFVMQHLDLKLGVTLYSVKKQIEKMVEKQLLTEEQAQTIYPQKITEFFKTDLGKRMIASKSVRREVPFNIEISSTEIFKELPKEIYEKEMIMIQGVIDCFFEEDGQFVLIDYKTDYADDAAMPQIKEKYKIQMDYYALALQQITGKTIKEKNLYLFGNQQIIKY